MGRYRSPADHFYFDNEYQSNDQDWQRYFLQFAAAARAGR
jgi:hypothetical protein